MKYHHFIYNIFIWCYRSKNQTLTNTRDVENGMYSEFAAGALLENSSIHQSLRGGSCENYTSGEN